MAGEEHLHEAARLREITGRAWEVRPPVPEPKPWRHPDAHLWSAARALERILRVAQPKYVCLVRVRPGRPDGEV